MASNNQRTPSAPPQPRWSNDGKKTVKEQQQQVLNQVKEMFGSILEPDIILSVVLNCKWKLQPSIDALIMLSENAEIPFNRGSQNFSQHSSRPMSNSMGMSSDSGKRMRNDDQDKTMHKSNVENDTTTGFLNLNDKELLRQQEEFRKFELLKKDLTDKEFVSLVNENVSKLSYPNESTKVPPLKLQQFGQAWSSGNQTTGKADFSKVYYCSDIESESPCAQINPTMNQLWGNTSNIGQRKAKETNNQFDNLFGSKLQFSRDLPDKIGNKGTIPKNNKTQNQQLFSPQQHQQHQNFNPDHPGSAQSPKSKDTKNLNPNEGSKSQSAEPNIKGFPYASIHFTSADYKSTDYEHDFQEPQMDQHQQQVEQFGSNYDDEIKNRTGNGKSNLYKGETESLCGLKVQYRLPGLENSSDDDADVVIEEERTDYPTQIPSLVSTNVCQFISSSIERQPKNTRPEMSVSSTPSPSDSPQHSTYDNTLQNIISSIIEGHKVLIITRGLPGSGKSHLVTNIVRSSVGGDPHQFVFSADDYFVMLGRGTYQFVRSKLTEAHSYTQKRAFKAMRDGVSPVIVDNTSTQSWEMQPYVVMGVQNGYIIEVVEPNTPWANNVNELVKRNTHGVSKDTIRHMIERYERNITGPKLVEQFSLRYSPDNVPPQYRKFPPLSSMSKNQEQQKNEKQKSTKRNRRRKKAQAFNSDDAFTVSNTDELDHLLSDKDKNMKPSANSHGSQNTKDTLENIVSNALMSENDTLNKSLVDYCIETDSSDEMDVDKVPGQQEDCNSPTDNNKVLDLLSENVVNDRKCEVPLSNNSSPSLSKDEGNSRSETMQNNDSPSKSNDFNTRKISSNLQHQSLGAIGSERKGSVTTIEYETARKNAVDECNQENPENILSQCWDFTLLVNGRQIHSTGNYKPSKTFKQNEPEFEDIEKEVDSNIETEIEIDPDYPTGVIITEIDTEEAEVEWRKSVSLVETFGDNISISEDPEVTITNIMKKMDAEEPEIDVECKMNPLDTDFISELVDTEPESSSESQGLIGSIFTGIKNSLLGFNSNTRRVEDTVRNEESMMKYKHQTNDNSLSETDAFENEMSHREPSVIPPKENDSQETEPNSVLTGISTTIVGDDLSSKLSDLNLNSTLVASTDYDKGLLCQLSTPVMFDNTENGANSKLVVNDTLTKKLAGENRGSRTQNQTQNPCAYSSIEANDAFKINEDETSNGQITNEKSQRIYESDREDLIALKLQGDGDQGEEENSKNLVESIDKLIISSQSDIDQIQKVEGVPENPCDLKMTGLEGNTSTEEISEIICKKKFAYTCGIDSNDKESESGEIEPSNLISSAEICKKETAKVPESNVTELLSTERESLSKSHDLKLTSDNKPEDLSPASPTENSLEYKSEYSALLEGEKESENNFESSIHPDNNLDDSSTEECCECFEECCELLIPSDTEDLIDVKPVENVDEAKTTTNQNLGGDGDKTESENKTVEIIDNMNQVTWKESPFPVERISPVKETEKKSDNVMKSDSSTNTSSYDFNVLYVGGTSEYRIMSAESRSINNNTSLVVEEKPPLKLMLDKSSMTSVVDILSGEESLEFRTEVETIKNMEKLLDMFPNVPHEDIMEIYKNLCNCDFDWTVDVLLDGVPENATKYTKIESPKIVLDRQATPSAGSSEAGDSESQNSTPHKERLDKIKQQSSSSESNEGNAKVQHQNSSPRKKKDRHRVSEEKLKLKRQIEEKMVINEASYNPHILRVKRWKNGEPDITTEEHTDVQTQIKNVLDSVQSLTSETEDCVEETLSPETSESTDDFTEDDIEPEEIMELNLGHDFIKILENEFGNPEFQFPDGLFPVIQIKKSMAQQLHALWIESMEQQLNAQQERLDQMIESDAEYARSLEQEEARCLTEPVVPNLSQIMDMEMALAIYNNDVKKQVKLETPNDMASRLTRQMLHEMFADHDPETLNEILNAHNGDYKETVEVLEASTGLLSNRNNTLKKQKSLIDRVKKESIERNEAEKNSQASAGTISSDLSEPDDSNFATPTYDASMEEAQESRKEAQRQLILRNENFNKATEAFRKGNREVAGYYSQMAKLHSKKMEYANSMAASAFLSAQDCLMNTENTLDLHYLYVAEALRALDIFLDHQLSKLSEGNKKSMNLYIITGRGARSAKGLSRIKPAVSKKLASKNIRFIEENPGCLKVVIHRRNIAMG
ncbi:NEDD4-binding protein 2 [Diprion similis]|uniref:NEDD4-binding protein 2 n=1 Tax=Diprion similis TaxID=362088 RepID=UPI001EF99C13|nr:NEDD4-binding protein 2 [Diprion similis]XP_046747164.1 NEDD4-binding protein 2 [Diprion similis]